MSVDSVFSKYINKKKKDEYIGKLPKGVQRYYDHLCASDHGNYTPYYQDRNGINNRVLIPINVLEKNGLDNIEFVESVEKNGLFKNGLNISISIQYFQDNINSNDKFKKYIIEHINSKGDVSVRLFIDNLTDKKKLDEIIQNNEWKPLDYIEGIFNKNGTLTKEVKKQYGLERKFHSNKIIDGHYIIDISTGHHKDSEKHNKKNIYMFCPYVDYCNENLIKQRKIKLLFIMLHFEDINNYVDLIELSQDRKIIKDYLISTKFDYTNLFDNTMYYELSNGKRKYFIKDDIAICPLLNQPLRFDRYHAENNSIHYCHDKAVCSKLLTIDKSQNSILSANAPINFFLGYQKGNNTQGDMTLEEYYNDMSDRSMKLGLSIPNAIHQKKEEEHVEEIEKLNGKHMEEIEKLKEENDKLKKRLKELEESSSN